MKAIDLSHRKSFFASLKAAGNTSDSFYFFLCKRKLSFGNRLILACLRLSYRPRDVEEFNMTRWYLPGLIEPVLAETSCSLAGLHGVLMASRVRDFPDDL